MKRIFNKITVFVLILATVLSLSACVFIRDTSGKDLADSKILAQSIKFYSETPSQREEMSLVNAVEKTEKSSVALEVISSGVTSMGSGTIINVSRLDGNNQPVSENAVYILTCQHVINSMGDLLLYIPDESCNYDNSDYIFAGKIGAQDYRESKATYNGKEVDIAVTLVGGDFESDVAVLRLDLNKKSVSGKKLTVDKLVKANINENYVVRKGEFVYSLGNPSGTMPGTLNAGYISYLNRVVSMENIGSMKLMQIDVSINHGSSGGGLYNMYGELIGITNGGSDDYTNLNLAIPMVVDETAEIDNGFINIVKNLMASYTGVNFGYVSGRQQKFGMTLTQSEENSSSYVYVSNVTSGGIAYSKGLKAKDVLLSASLMRDEETVASNGNITTLAEFNDIAEQFKIGDKLTLVFKRNGYVTSKEYSYEFLISQYHFCDTGK